MNPLSDIFSKKLPQFRWNNWKNSKNIIIQKNINFFVCHKEKIITFDRIIDNYNRFNSHSIKQSVNEPKYNKWIYMESDEITYNFYINNGYKLI